MRTPEHGQVAFGASTIEYRVERSDRRKTITVAVDPADGVVLKAPTNAPSQKLVDVVSAKGAWILQRILEYRELGPTPPRREFVSGENYLYLGRQYRLKVLKVGSHSASKATLRGGFLEVSVDQELDGVARVEAVRTSLVRWYREHASRRLPERVAVYASRAGLPVPPVLIRGQQKRWGSCSSKGELRLNWRIIMAGMTLVDYVVAHEVCHLEIRDHSADFWKLLGTLMPDYEERRSRLRIEGIGYRI